VSAEYKEFKGECRMRGPLSKAVRQEFELGLERIAPQFSLLEGENIPAGCRVYRVQSASALYMFIFFQPHRKMDAFTLEIACSKAEHWPSYFVRVPVDLYELWEGEIRFRLARLWGNGDHWWYVGTKEEVKPTVAEALTKLEVYALPYFARMTGGSLAN
jgi:hypothetical protein